MQNLPCPSVAYYLVVLVAPRDGQVVASLRQTKMGEHIATVTRGPTVLGHEDRFQAVSWADDDFRISFEDWCGSSFPSDVLETLYLNATTVEVPDGPKPLDWRYTVIINEEQRIGIEEALAMYVRDGHASKEIETLHEMVRDMPSQDNRPGVTFGLTI